MLRLDNRVAKRVCFGPCIPSPFLPHRTSQLVQIDAKDKEIERLKDELKAAREYSQVCEDESVELRRKVFQMTKEMSKLKKDLEHMASCTNKKQQADITPLPTPAPTSTSRKRSTRKTLCDTMMMESSASGDGSDSAPSGGDHDIGNKALRRSARRAGRPPSTGGLMDGVAPVPKRKASARAAAASVEREERPAPISSKKKRVGAANFATSSADSEGDKVVETLDARAQRVAEERRHGAESAAGMSELPDPQEDQEADPPATAVEQMQLLDVLAEASLQQQAGWLPRMKALKHLKLLMTTPGLLQCDRDAFVKKMLPSLVVQTSDARSQVVRETCGLIAEVLPFLQDYHEDVAKILIPQLWKLTYVSQIPSRHHLFASHSRVLSHLVVVIQLERY